MPPVRRSITATPRKPPASALERNIEALRTRRQQDEGARSRRERAADQVSGFAGSITFVAIQLMLFGS